MAGSHSSSRSSPKRSRSASPAASAGKRQKSTPEPLESSQETVFSAAVTALEAPESPLSSVWDDAEQWVSSSWADRFATPAPASGVPPPVAISSPELPEENLFARSKALVAACDAEQKPAPSGRPVAWAEGRQELCESLPYFRSYQGGGYTSNGFAYGFMFDKASHARDLIDESVVISRAGGGMAKDDATKTLKQVRDQTVNAAVRGVQNSAQQYNPVVIIAGKGNPKVTARLPHQYNVLDWFKPTHVWFEKSNGKKIIRYRFEKLQRDQPSWWAPGSASSAESCVELGSLPVPISKLCLDCGEKSQQIYLNGWSCLEPHCAKFWIYEDGSAPVDEELVYDPRFLKQYTPWPNSEPPYPVRPELPTQNYTDVAGQDTAIAAWRGIVCPKCGRCNSRELFEKWTCLTPDCDFELGSKHTVIPAATMRDPFFPLGTSYTMSRDVCSSHVKMETSFKHHYRVNRFSLPGIDGFVTHLIASKTVNEESGGPDDMFAALQTANAGFRRIPLSSSMSQGRTLTSAFYSNFGMPYKFVAAVNSRSFEDAPTTITDARARLNWASEFVAPATHQDFNEVLALGYFEGQKIDYHDDGEKDLGPTIATLSLGAPATMSLRLKDTHYHGTSKAGILSDLEPVPGSKHYDLRKTALDTLAQEFPNKSGPAYNKRLKELPKELSLGPRSGEAAPAIEMTLGHGDIVVMHGSMVQKYYEHAVKHVGKLRFALTCRNITVPESEMPTYEVKPCPRTYDGSKLV